MRSLLIFFFVLSWLVSWACVVVMEKIFCSLSTLSLSRLVNESNDENVFFNSASTSILLQVQFFSSSDLGVQQSQ